MPDPLDVLRVPDEPIAPRPEFATELRHQLEVALMTTPTTTTLPRTPPDHRVLCPYLIVHDARAAIAFYTDVLGATAIGEPIVMDDGRIGHAELSFGDADLALADEFPEMNIVGPRTLGGTPVSLTLYVHDCDAATARAVAAGAVVLREPADEFYGARSASIEDPFGHRWSLQQQLT